MKQKHKKSIVHSSLHLLLFGGVILLAASLHPQPAPIHNPSHAPTKPPVPISSTPEAKPKTTIVTAKQTKSASSAKRTVSAAPKQQEIKAAVQHEYVYRMFATPNDPQYASNWALNKVNAPAAWNIATGNSSTVVAVIDTGFGLNHEDLESRWYQNQGETGMTQSGGRCWTGTPADKRANTCDDDNNGYVDDWQGWSFVNTDNDPQAGRLNPTGDGTSHGTEVSGIVGANTNNGTGIAALDWNTKIMPLQVLDDDGTGYTSDVTAAIYYAVDNGAQVINMSLGAYANDPALRVAVNYATSHNVVVVAATGNCGDGSGPECVGVPAGTVAYPAAFPSVIAVGATTSGDQRAYFSSYGPSVDVSAPGYNVPASTAWSTDNQTSLYSGGLYGTSFASPMVASLAALIKSIRPSTSVADVTALIDATASKPSTMNGALYTEQLGHGVINAGSALSIAATLNGSTTATPTLLQAGSMQSEHTAPSSSMIGSGCQSTSGSACTIQFTGTSGHSRYLPYSVVSGGTTGWSWSADMLSADNWELRARRGDNVSTTPYYLTKKG